MAVYQPLKITSMMNFNGMSKCSNETTKTVQKTMYNMLFTDIIEVKTRKTQKNIDSGRHWVVKI